VYGPFKVKKNKNSVDSLWQGTLAEPLIHDSILPFIKAHSKGSTCVVQAFHLGLVKSREDHVSAVSPDAICVVECSTAVLRGDDDSTLASYVRKLFGFLSTITDNDNVESLAKNSDGFVVFNVVATMEYKHKSETVTQQEARRIVSQILNEQKVVVLNLLDDEDATTFRSAIPNIDYRCQVLHECVTCMTNVGIYAVATTRIEFSSL
jgi:hypothetical protein